MTTLDWGHSTAYRQPVVEVLAGRVSTTLQYVVPGVALAAVLGVVVGVVVAFGRDGPLDLSARLVAYGLVGVPAFMLVVYVETVGGPLTAPLVVQSVAILVVAAGVLGGLLRFARTAALERAGESFVRALRRDLFRHVLRNVGLQVVSLSVSELLSVLVLTIYVVEAVLPIDGLARVSLRAVRESDVALTVWSTLVIVAVGIVATLVTDLLYGYLDPRVRSASGAE